MDVDLSSISWMKAEKLGYKRKEWCLAMSAKRQKRRIVQPPKKKVIEKKPFVMALEKYSCIHRGDVVEMTTCKSCGGGTKPLEIHACELFGDCTVDRLGDKITGGCCKVCDKRQGKPIIGE